jgi:hypothetical protein
MYLDICRFQVDEEPVFEAGGEERLDICVVTWILYPFHDINYWVMSLDKGLVDFVFSITVTYAGQGYR